MENLFHLGRIHLISLRWGCWRWSRPWLTMRSWSQSWRRNWELRNVPSLSLVEGGVSVSFLFSWETYLIDILYIYIYICICVYIMCVCVYTYIHTYPSGYIILFYYYEVKYNNKIKILSVLYIVSQKFFVFFSCDGKTTFSAAITPVFNVTWSLKKSL